MYLLFWAALWPFFIHSAPAPHFFHWWDLTLGCFFDHCFILWTYHPLPPKCPTSEQFSIFFFNSLMWYIIGQNFDQSLIWCISRPSSLLPRGSTFLIFSNDILKKLIHSYHILWPLLHITQMCISLLPFSKFPPVIFLILPDRLNVTHHWSKLWPLFSLIQNQQRKSDKKELIKNQNSGWGSFLTLSPSSLNHKICRV